MRFCLAFGFLAAITRCSCPPVEIPSWQEGVNFASKLALRVKKNADDGGYLEECTFVDSWQGEPGFINVLAFLDASWEYSHRQASMLKMLQDRLINIGILEVRFFVINSADAEAASNNLDLEGEKEAWGQAEPTEDQTLSEIERTREALKKKIDPDIAFIQDTEELKVWEKLSASRDQVLVVDKCGRLTYRVIVPWSILHFPYVKAAILSTYKEQPCGECGVNYWGSESTTTMMMTTMTMTTTLSNKAESQTEEFADSLPDDFNVDQMKEIAVKKYKLDDIGSTVTKIYHNNEPQEIPENIIKLLNGTASMRKNSTLEAFGNSTKHQTMLLTGDPEIDREFSIGLISEFSDQTENQEENDSNDHSENISTSTEIFSDSPDEDTEQQNDANISSTIVNESNVTSKPITVYSVDKGIEGFNEYYTRGHKDQLEKKKNYSETDQRNSEMEDFLSAELNKSVDEDRENESHSFSLNTPGSSESVTEIQVSNNIDRITEEYGSGEEHSQNADYVIPIRIIMHAPHIHKYEEPKRKHEYLVLKLGDPDYHGHLEPDEEFYGVNAGSDNHDEENDQNKNGSRTDNNNNEDSHSHHRHRHQYRKNGYKGDRDERTDAIYDKDESPGFYGEDAEYWRNFGNAEYQEKLKIEHTGKKIEYGKENEEEIKGAVNIGTDKSGAIIEDSIDQETTPADQDSLTTEAYTELPEKMSDEDVIKDDEITNRLIEHYSKLIPWLDYVFDE